jgi:hypothetical protein
MTTLSTIFLLILFCILSLAPNFALAGGEPELLSFEQANLMIQEQLPKHPLILNLLDHFQSLSIDGSPVYGKCFDGLNNLIVDTDNAPLNITLGKGFAIGDLSFPPTYVDFEVAYLCGLETVEYGEKIFEITLQVKFEGQLSLIDGEHKEIEVLSTHYRNI